MRRLFSSWVIALLWKELGDMNILCVEKNIWKLLQIRQLGWTLIKWHENPKDNAEPSDKKK